MTTAIQINAAAPPRGGGTQNPVVFLAQSIQLTYSWGTNPGSATVCYVARDAGAQWGGVLQGALVTINIPAVAPVFTFRGLCKSDTPVFASEGQSRTLEFVDFREYLGWDVIYAAFNLPDVRLVNGTRQKRYKQMYPADFNAHAWTYTDAPLSARAILEAVFASSTVQSPWTKQYDSAQDLPVFGMDWLGGKKLGEVLAEVSERQGLLFTIQGGSTGYNLVWARKGVGTLPAFPATSNERIGGGRLSGKPTRVRVVGARNEYQVLDLEMAPDWAPAWQQFLDFSLFADDIFNRASDPGTGARYNAMPGDVEEFIGRQLANARAMLMTLREYVALRGSEGAPFADQRLFAKRLRMDMPCALYIATLLFRAFRLPAVTLTNASGVVMQLAMMDIADRLLCRVSHDPANYNPGAAAGMGIDTPPQPVDGNGYVIAKGFQVGLESFRNLKPDRFDPGKWTNAQLIWSQVPFQIDASGEGDRFIILDEPMIVTSDLVQIVDGLAVLKAAPTITVPPVNAGLVLEGEFYTRLVGTGSLDAVENVGELNAELVLSINPGAAFTPVEIKYADGHGADFHADQIGNTLLLNQPTYTDGGFKYPGLLPLALSGVIDRVTVVVGPSAGVYTEVHFTSEQTHRTFVPEREMDRATLQNSLLPGQAQLRDGARESELLAAGFKHNHKFVLALGDALHGRVGSSVPLDPMAVTGGSGTLPAGTPLWKAAQDASAPAGTNSRAVMPSAVTADTHKVFAGVTVRDGEDATKPMRGQTAGAALVRVKGPVAVGDVLGQSPGADYLVGGSGMTAGTGVGIAQGAVAGTSVKLIAVQLGGGGGGVTSVRWG